MNDNNRSNQLNPNNDAFWRSRGYSGRPDNWKSYLYSSSSSSSGSSSNSINEMNYNNRSNELNRNNDAFWRSREYSGRPDNWYSASNSSSGSSNSSLSSYCTNEMNYNRSNELNPNNDAFWRSRGYSGRPKNWKSYLNSRSSSSSGWFKQ